MKRKIIGILLCAAVLCALLTMQSFAADIVEGNIASGDGWYLDGDGCLHITGAVDNPSTTSDKTPWKAYKSQIMYVDVEYGSSVSNGAYLFAGCTNMESADLYGLDTADVTDMSYMFSNCTYLWDIYPLWFDTSNVTNMSHMFSGCAEFWTFDLSNFDTSSVTDMSYMFSGCEHLLFLDLSGFNTENAENMEHMFSDGVYLETLSAGPDIIKANADDLASTCDLWVDERTHAFYKTAAQLKTIDSTADLIRPANSGEGWYIDRENCLHLTGAVKNPNIRDNEIEFDYINTKSPWCYVYPDVYTIIAEEGAFITNGAYLFAGLNDLTSIDLTKLDTAGVTDMEGMFKDCESLKTLDLRSFDTSSVSYMSWMFSGCTGLTSINMSGFDTYSVTDMYGMFMGCSSLKSLDVTGFDTSSVTDMGSMFDGCSGIKFLDVSGFDTSNAKNTGFMFSGCSSLKSLDVSGFDTSSVMDMCWMFSGCSGLTALDVSGFDTSKVEEMDYMFSGCSGLTSLDVTGFDTSSVRNMRDMFDNCSSLTSLDLSGFDVASGYHSDLLYGCNSLEKLCITPFFLYANADILISISSGWENESTHEVYTSADALEAIDSTVTLVQYAAGEGWYLDADGCLHLTGAVKNPGTTSDNTQWKKYKTEIKTVVAEEGASITNGMYLFNGCKNLTSADLSKLDTSAVTNMYYMFYGCPRLESIDLSGFDTGNVKNMNYMFYGCSFLEDLDVSGFDTGKVTSMNYMFRNCTSLEKLSVTPAILAKNAGDLISISSEWVSESTGEVYDSSAKLKAIAEPVTLVRPRLIDNIIDSGDGWYLDEDYCLHFTGAVDIEPWFKYSKQIVSVVAEKGSSIPCGDYLFDGFENLKTADLSKLDTSACTDMSFMFNGCSSLVSLDVSGFDTSHVKDMHYMFKGCSSLVSLDLSDFDTENVTDMSYMFNDCESLNSLNLSGFNTSLVTNMDHMFYYCRSLTELDVSRFNTENVTNMEFMFANCFNLVTVDVSGFDTSKVEYMESMFFNCKDLEELDVSGFDVSGTRSLAYMFTYCSSLTSLDVSGFDTSHVTDMRYMFCECWSLLELDVSGFDTSSAEYYSSMFTNCTSLEKLSITPDILSKNSDRLIEIYPVWENENTGKIYEMSNQLNAITSPVTLIRTVSHAPAVTWNDGWYLDEDGCLHLMGGVDNFSESYDKTEWQQYKSRIKSVVAIDGAHMRNCSYLFYGCINLKNADLSKLGTGACSSQSFNNIFKLCNSLEKLSVTPAILAKNADDLMDISSEWVNESTFEVYDSSAELKAIASPVTLVRPGLIDNIIDSGDGWYLDEDYCLHFTGAVDIEPWFKYSKQIVSVVAENGSSIPCGDYLFVGFENLKTADLSKLDTSACTDMSFMFDGCSSLVSLDVSGFDTSHVKDMHYMFNGCSSLVSLDLSGFDTSHVKDMHYMFSDCPSLVSLDLSGFDTSLVTDMSYMFLNCQSLKEVDVSHLNTASVRDMTYMFQSCIRLESLDLSGFDTSNVESMCGMFFDCIKLKELDVSGFKTSNVRYMVEMFSCCRSLQSVDVSGFDTSAVTDMDWMFYGCSSLTSLNLSGFDTSSVTYMDGMFANCSSLTSLNLSGFDTSSAQTMQNMFSGCSSLTTLDVTGFVTTTVSNMSGMFFDCEHLSTVDVTGFDTSRVTNMESMFSMSWRLTSLDVSGFDTSKVTDMSRMFANCQYLTSLDVSGFDTSRVVRMDDMFNECSGLTALDVSGFDTGKVTSMKNMFRNCTFLEKLGITPAILVGNASDIHSISLEWLNESTGEIYASTTELKAITSPVTLVRFIAPSKTSLKSAIDDAEALDLSGYTAESQAAFAEALAAAKSVYEKETAVQAEVDAAESALLDAIDALVVYVEPENSASLSLEGDIGVNFYLDLDAYADAQRVEITCADPDSDSGNTVTYVFENLDEMEIFKFTVETAAAQMTEPVSVVIYGAENSMLYTSTITVQGMLETYIEYYADYPAITDLCKTMLSYGANAQRYFDYNVSVLADENYGADSSAVNALLVEGFDTLWADADETDNFAYAAQTFSCRSSTVMRYAFTVDKGMSAADFTAEFTEGGDGLALEITDKGNQVVVSVTGIPAALLDNYFAFTVKCGEKDMGAVSSCAMCYAKLVLNSTTTSDELKELVKSIYVYNEAANTYFGK